MNLIWRGDFFDCQRGESLEEDKETEAGDIYGLILAGQFEGSQELSWPEIPLSAFWQPWLNFGETLSEEAEEVFTFRILANAYYGETLSEEAEKVIGYLVTSENSRQN